jgi:catechol 2,3-dioxygenase-like lactoylglutathione lyase family enzyme
MAKLRHIALSVRDLDAARKFFVEAFDMKVVGQQGDIAVNLSDGTMSVVLLALKGKPLGYEKDEPFYGIDHFGMWVDDLEAARRKAEAAGAKYVMGESPEAPGAFYEIKYRDPMGNIFDLTTHGWAGAVKDVVPAEPARAKAEAAE